MRRLFTSDGYAWFQQRAAQAAGAVAAQDPDDLRHRPEQVVDRLVEAHAVHPLLLAWDEVTRGELRETRVQRMGFFNERVSVSAHAIDFYVPFDGSPELFQLRATTFTPSGTPDAQIVTGQLTLQVETTSANHDEVMEQFQGLRKQVQQHVDWINSDAVSYNRAARGAVQAAVDERKKRLDAAAALSDKLTIPLRRAAPNRQVPIPVTRKTVRPTSGDGRPSAAAEPALTDAIYEDVLRTLRATANSFERLPETARRFKEEELRDVLLFILNSNYEGAAAGEVFNGEGKTDILLRYQDRNAFIGECKMWRGEKQFAEAVDQLLSYTVWRDTRAALIPFIRAKDATTAIRRAEAAIREHPNFVRSLPSTIEARQDFVMQSTQDSQRQIRLALLPVVLGPSKSDGSGAILPR